MITINIMRNKKKDIYSFDVFGHADAAPHGEDVVCAGVSALTQTAILGLTKHLVKKIDLDISSGKLRLIMLDAPDEKTNAILETMFLGLKEISKIYPDSVRILEHRR